MYWGAGQNRVKVKCLKQLHHERGKANSYQKQRVVHMKMTIKNRDKTSCAKTERN